MIGYLSRRFLSFVLTLLLVSLLIFLVLYLIPGDPAQVIVGPEASKKQISKVREKLGLSGPLIYRYWEWLKDIFQGDMGNSIKYGLPVKRLIGSRLTVTLPLTGMAVFIGLILAFPLGIIAALRKDRSADWIISIIAQIGLSVPSFWLGLVFITIFATILNLFPAGGFVPWSDSPMRSLNALFLPSLALGIALSAELIRILRSAILDVLNEEYIKVARSKGLSAKGILFKHVLSNSLLSVITLFGLQVGRLVAGTIIIEEVFSLPGLGDLLINSVWRRDYPVIQGTVLVVSGFIIIINFIVDLLYGSLDPRIRLENR